MKDDAREAFEVLLDSYGMECESAASPNPTGDATKQVLLRRDAVLAAFEAARCDAFGWHPIWDLESASAPISPAAQEGERAVDDLGPRGYAARLAVALAAKFYPDVPQWRVLEDLPGILTQIDNMSTGLVRASSVGEPSDKD